MLSPEYVSTIKDQNLLRARIMLKDSLLVDPTFVQFDEMLTYARNMLPDIVAPFDGDMPETDQNKWDVALMNVEMVELVNNFSDVRIRHLKQVVSKVVAVESTKKQEKKAVDRTTHTTPPKDLNVRRQALSKMGAGANRVEKLMRDAERRGNRWSLAQVEDMERAARQILNAIKEYKENK